MKTVCILTPVYNEETVIEKWHQAIRSITRFSTQYDYCILFVLDRCTDNTLSVVKKICKEDPAAQAIYMSSRFGHQAALLAGIDHCESDVLIMMDSDLQHPPELIPKLLAEIEKGADVVLTHRDDGKVGNPIRRMASSIFYKLLNFFSDVPIAESAPDFRAITKKVVRVFQNQIRERNQFMRGLFSWIGFETAIVHYHSTDRQGGTTKYSFNRLIKFAIDGVLSFSKKPLKYTIVLGFIFAGFAFLVTCHTIYQYLIHQHLPSGWATLSLLISFFSGIQLISMGVVGLYIGAIFDEVKQRPHYIIDQKINFDA